LGKLESPTRVGLPHQERAADTAREINDRGWDHWAEEGCKLSNEVNGFNVYKDRALKLRKKHGRLTKPRMGSCDLGAVSAEAERHADKSSVIGD
jgi:hypothetical protein